MPEPREIDVTHVARLARLNLTAEETELFQKQLEQVLEYAGKLRDVVAGVSPAEDAMDFAGEAPAATRVDEARDWFTAEEALSNAPREANDLFIVPKVVE
jgi:aspartyl-tRNA(Asn)/glutamyl-tRNA(Gln) amidotransferase subunit C